MTRKELLTDIYKLLGTKKGLSGLEKCHRWCLVNLKKALEVKLAI